MTSSSSIPLSTTSGTTSSASPITPSFAARSRRASGLRTSPRPGRSFRTAASRSPPVRSRLGRGDRSLDDRRPTRVDALSPFHVWTPDYAMKRLGWKRRDPLHIMLLRVYPSGARSRCECATSTTAAARGWTSSATSRSRARPLSPTTSSTALRRLSATWPASPSRAGLALLPFPSRVADASRALVLGIGGGGDAVGSIALRIGWPSEASKLCWAASHGSGWSSTRTRGPERSMRSAGRALDGAVIVDSTCRRDDARGHSFLRVTPGASPR